MPYHIYIYIILVVFLGFLSCVQTGQEKDLAKILGQANSPTYSKKPYPKGIKDPYNVQLKKIVQPDLGGWVGLL